jgi:hypothetical protein
MAEDGRGEVGDPGVVEVAESFGAREFRLVDERIRRRASRSSHSAVSTSARNAL